MAFIKDFLDRFGNTHESAYFRITQLFIRWDAQVAGIKLAIYKDKDSRLAGRDPVSEDVYYFSEEVGVGPFKFSDFFGMEKLADSQYDVISEVYTELMKRPEYEGARADLTIEQKEASGASRV